jgi:hypothetical protein
MTSQSRGNPVFFQALQIPNPNVNEMFHISSKIDTGFSRIIPADLPAGNYQVGEVQHRQDIYQPCLFKKTLSIR